MLDCEIKNGWVQFLEFIETRCSSAEFENWISPISLIEATPEKILLEVPNVYVQDYLLDNFKEVLCNFLPLLPSGEPAIQFRSLQLRKRPPSPHQNPWRQKRRRRFTNSNSIPFIHLKTLSRGPPINLSNRPLSASRHGRENPTTPFLFTAASALAKHTFSTASATTSTNTIKNCGSRSSRPKRSSTISSITSRNKSIDKMKRFYRTLDVLLVDDIQFLQNRLNFEEEFCNTFEALLNQNKQIVITSDKPPAQLKLSERMVARMEWGLVAHMGIPDLETRVAIIKHKSESRGLNIPNQIAFFIAEHIYNNVRQIEGAINRLSAHSDSWRATSMKRSSKKSSAKCFSTAPRIKKSPSKKF